MSRVSGRRKNPVSAPLTKSMKHWSDSVNPSPAVRRLHQRDFLNAQLDIVPAESDMGAFSVDNEFHLARTMVVPKNLDNFLVVGVSSSALFDTRMEHSIYEKDGLEAYIDHQITNEDEPFAPGPAYPLVKAMLQLNEVEGTRRVEVVVPRCLHRSLAYRI